MLTASIFPWLAFFRGFFSRNSEVPLMFYGKKVRQFSADPASEVRGTGSTGTSMEPNRCDTGSRIL